MSGGTKVRTPLKAFVVAQGMSFKRAWFGLRKILMPCVHVVVFDLHQGMKYIDDRLLIGALQTFDEL